MSAVIVKKAHAAPALFTHGPSRKMVLGQDAKWPDGKVAFLMTTSGHRA